MVGILPLVYQSVTSIYYYKYCFCFFCFSCVLIMKIFKDNLSQHKTTRIV